MKNVKAGILILTLKLQGPVKKIFFKKNTLNIIFFFKKVVKYILKNLLVPLVSHFIRITFLILLTGINFVQWRLHLLQNRPYI